ncbi:helix-turn-helix domain-containing protein [Micromonospora parastrephiae]|uniref:helix-turn-helix domain-containing protein n=1 Tax=Micromonospora parastrephiae TaxID=2806101 RepID=UPI00281531E3|nr:helix-turn-helix domain-containing protein [Micromonospora parastrephiae]
MALVEPVRVRRLIDQEGQRLQRLVRRGTGSVVRLRRAMVVLASAGGNSVPVICPARAADEDSVRQVIHRFNEMGMASLDPLTSNGWPGIDTTGEESLADSSGPPGMDRMDDTTGTSPAKLGTFA